MSRCSIASLHQLEIEITNATWNFSSCYLKMLPHLKLIPICDIFCFSLFLHETRNECQQRQWRPQDMSEYCDKCKRNKKNERTQRDFRGIWVCIPSVIHKWKHLHWRFCWAAAYSLICQLSHTNSLVISTLKMRMKKNRTRTIFSSREREREISQQVHITVVLLCSIYASAFFVVVFETSQVFSFKNLLRSKMNEVNSQFSSPLKANWVSQRKALAEV